MSIAFLHYANKASCQETAENIETFIVDDLFLAQFFVSLNYIVLCLKKKKSQIRGKMSWVVCRILNFMLINPQSVAMNMLSWFLNTRGQYEIIISESQLYINKQNECFLIQYLQVLYVWYVSEKVWSLPSYNLPFSLGAQSLCGTFKQGHHQRKKDNKWKTIPVSNDTQYSVTRLCFWVPH